MSSSDAQLFVLTCEPYHANSRILGVFSSIEKAREAGRAARATLTGWERIVDRWADDQSNGLFDRAVLPEAKHLNDLVIYRFFLDVMD